MMKLKAKIFVEHNSSFILGPGRLTLLQAVKKLGSLRKAANELGMSYRWAWGRLNSAEKELGFALMARTDEPVGGRPKVLTAEAKAIIAWFDEVEAKVQVVMTEAESGMPQCLRQLQR